MDCSLKLPDELVVKCISGLTLKEAVRTSVISKRWINLWKSTDLVLDFDVKEELTALFHGLINNRRKMNCVNGVIEQLAQHNNKYSLKVVKFRVAVFLIEGCSSQRDDIDKWLEFAISNIVESIHLDFHIRFGNPKNYIFSEDCYNHIKTPAGLSQIKSLKSLYLSFVRVKDEIVEHMAANCPLLEELVLINTSGLNKLRVVGSSHSPLPLKRLVISFRQLELVEIAYTPCLVQLVYSCTFLQDFRLDKCTSLVDLTLVLRGDVVQARQLLELFSGCASQLRFLFVKLCCMSQPLYSLPEHTCLERLAIKTESKSYQCILGLIPLINQCPRLHTLQVFFYNYYAEEGLKFAREEVDYSKIVRKSVKVVEISGFSGYELEVEFVEYVMKYFVCLERIKINRCSEKQARMAKDIALEFKSKASPAIEFIVI
ncbi:Putative F-box protein At5g38390 [Linum perenne]